MTTTPVSPAAEGSQQREPQQHPGRYEFVPTGFAHPDATDRIVAGPRPSFAQSMGARSTEFKNALIAGGVGIAVAFLAAGFGLGYWAGDAGSSSTPQSGVSQMGPGQAGSGQMGSGQMGSGQAGGQFGGTQNGVPGGAFGGQTQDGTDGAAGSGTGTGTTTG
ncbi:hypothetical protein [Williamsia sp.]|uniref:hypothetical protein n=1 Tax=Williamsia sp. TaxID=1872085 RepID=UPI001A310715|nr:hypothetical protein [Williamsia sp.]MBJ7289291.1 hypothetical protein [Williamsia sp.]